ncbi:hypothetical protein KFL_000700190 [Klebsormidium nitens]|uniref:Transmembrane protein n=1 Tax=Klebsormidium nitens TaxID=105231 RepID=A0A1Y1HTB3_KLENI|nr:hypothetical protein KFL_000700190 [Klebsormidium nitens]|eukprot:GAQ81082.1 hypothetical protein KFL_000700190 [Klebsormidium nitens]
MDLRNDKRSRRSRGGAGLYFAGFLLVIFLIYSIYLFSAFLVFYNHPSVSMNQNEDSEFRAPVISACSFEGPSSIPLDYGYLKMFYSSSRYFFFNFGPNYQRARAEGKFPDFYERNNISGDRNSTTVQTGSPASADTRISTFYWLQPSNLVRSSAGEPVTPPQSWCIVYFPNQLRRRTTDPEQILQPHVSLDFSLSFGGHVTNDVRNLKPPKVLHWQFNDYPTNSSNDTAQADLLADLQHSVDLSTRSLSSLTNEEKRSLYTAQGHGFAKLVVGNSTHVLALKKNKQTRIKSKLWLFVGFGATTERTFYTISSMSTLNQVEPPLPGVDAATVQMSLLRDSNDISMLRERSPTVDIISNIGGAWNFVPLAYWVAAILFGFHLRNLTDVFGDVGTWGKQFFFTSPERPLEQTDADNGAEISRGSKLFDSFSTMSVESEQNEVAETPNSVSDRSAPPVRSSDAHPVDNV